MHGTIHWCHDLLRSECSMFVQYMIARENDDRGLVLRRSTKINRCTYRYDKTGRI